jgi:catechol 2,3-dioxygenase-like lactoylglutathione lyase family enzyme
MEKEAKAIRPFIGARDYELSRSFYQALGFQEVILSHNMCLFKTDRIGFYLQDAYAKDWIDNTMVFVEVDDVDAYFEELAILDLPSKYPGAKLTPAREYDWGKECFLHDPSGILWHFGQFKKPAIV